MHIFMHENRRGWPDGFNCYHYGKGIVYFDVPHTLAAHFINRGYARIATLQDMDDQLERAKEAV